ncbi:MAG: agmatine deiminase family protein [Puniceicoccaceae bacterium]
MSSPVRFPGEWEPHRATWIFWPTDPGRYFYGRAGDFPSILEAYRRLADVLCAFETVHVAVDPRREAEARATLGGRAIVHGIPLDDAWARDAAPTFVSRGDDLSAVCWRFTGWGGRFGPIDRDAAAAPLVAGLSAARNVCSTTVGMEGGGILSDGRGLVLTTVPVLFDPGRNPGKDPASLRAELAGLLGARRLVELPSGFAGDDTGGHVDVVAAVSPSGAVLLNDCRDRDDPNAAGSAANRRALADAGCEVVPVPQPGARFAGKDRLPYSYLNLYPCNGAVLVPAFGDRLDGYVRDLVAEHFPDREVIPLDARPFYLGGGGLHCVTQPVPEIGCPRGHRR